MRFSWDDLRYFLAVARSGQLSSAARRLRSSHATVSRRIENLELALSAKLFERNPQGYVLTPAGQRLLASARRIEQEAERLQEAATDFSPVRGAVRLSTLEGFGNYFLADRMRSFTDAFPNISLELVTIQQIMALSRKEADLLVTLDPPKSGPYVCEKLTDYTLKIYGAKEYLRRHPPIVDPAQVGHHPFIGYIDDMIFSPGLDYLHDVLPGLKAKFQASSIMSQLKATQQGIGLCVLPVFMGEDDPLLEVVCPEAITIERTYWLVVPDQAHELASVRAVAGYLRKEVSSTPEFFLGDQALN
ncbi:LysR family transcriptional regulator [Limoniibacter endophyticus]|uniref:Transcriptional regulator n=1 Tax=Limoniibacter endophyticus TaxID=1565040 RepID=A0A8J3DM84_9HYPH|nr:LysR family transcriptional regulator [Limoniibacter endophyticus]GHC66769.1 transcriptional regulator [Limoniibacter endophyticus]